MVKRPDFLSRGITRRSDSETMRSVATATRTRPVVAPAAKPLESVPATSGLARPETAAGNRVVWTYVVGVGSYHALSLLALSPWFFSWSGVCWRWRACMCLARWESIFASTGCSRIAASNVPSGSSIPCRSWGLLPESPARWVIAHRIHHQHSDDQADPHSPLVNFFWGHMGWLFVENHATKSAACDRYARDILRDPFYMRASSRDMFWLWVNVIQAGLFYLVGAAIGWATTGSLAKRRNSARACWYGASSSAPWPYGISRGA